MWVTEVSIKDNSINKIEENYRNKEIGVSAGKKADIKLISQYSRKIRNK